MDCPICYSIIKDKDKIITNCNHIYHKECLDEWFKISYRCPLCRESKFNMTIKDHEKNYWKNREEIDKLINSCEKNLFNYI